MIDSQIINRLIEDELVIADLSYVNPNVFYEIGIRHCQNKPIIHLFLSGQVIPFDIKPYRAIEFSLRRPEDLTLAAAALASAVSETERGDFRVENPVTRARGVEQFDRVATAPEQVLRAEIAALAERLAIMENRAVPVSAPVTKTAAVRSMATLEEEMAKLLGRAAPQNAGTIVVKASPALADTQPSTPDAPA